MRTETDENDQRGLPEVASPADLAAYLGVPLQTVHLWRHKGTGPRGCRVGKYVRYRRADVEAWLEDHADPQ